MVEQVARVAVVVAHELLAPSNHGLLGIPQLGADESLEAQGEDVARPSLLTVVELVADSQKKLEGILDRLESHPREPPFLDELLELARLAQNPEHPDQVVVVAQAAAALLHVRLLQMNRVSVFPVPVADIDGALPEVGFFLTAQAVVEKGLLEAIEQFRVARDVAGIEQGRLGVMVAIGELGRAADAAHGIAHVESEVEERGGDPLHHLANGVVRLFRTARNEELQVDVATRIATMESISPETLDQVEEVLAQLHYYLDPPEE